MIEYEEDWLVWTLLHWHGGVYKRSSWFALPGAMVTLAVLFVRDEFPELDKALGFRDLDESIIWSALTVVLLGMVSFRTRMGYGRFWEGTGLLHQMKGEWFDTISNCVTFSISARKRIPLEVNRFRHTLVRLMSLCHASALEEISQLDEGLNTIDPLGLDFKTLDFLRDCVEVHGFNKVEVLLHLIQSVITNAQEEGILQVPPPILSRVYQTASRGYVNLLNTKKITDTKFPFPYVQLINSLLFFHVLLTPLCLTSLIAHKVLAPLLAFITLFGMFSLNLVAIELENPFGEDDNDLPLAHFQHEMNNCLLMLLHDETDLVACPSPVCNMDFAMLCRTTRANSVASMEGGPPLPAVHHGKRLSRRLSDACSAASVISDRSVPLSRASAGDVRLDIGPERRRSKDSAAEVRQVKPVLGPSASFMVTTDSDRMVIKSGGTMLAEQRVAEERGTAKTARVELEGVSSEFSQDMATMLESLQKFSHVMEEQASELLKRSETLDRMNVEAKRKLDDFAVHDADSHVHSHGLSTSFQGFSFPTRLAHRQPGGDYMIPECIGADTSRSEMFETKSSYESGGDPRIEI